MSPRGTVMWLTIFCKACKLLPMAKYGQKIIYFFCRPCGEYHLRTHPDYRAMQRRKLKVKKAKLAGLASVGDTETTPRSLEFRPAPTTMAR